MPVSANKLGRYELRQEIARSNDVVYEAWDPVLSRRVAVKEMVIPPGADGTAEKDRIERFLREARAAGRLTHPNIVTIYEVGEDLGRHFIAMEYLDGPTLREALKGTDGLPVDQAVTIAAQLADALGYAHQNGVVHRDIKPDNVHLITPNLPKLTDFGIARIQTEANITVAGQVFGTPSYMSPEQIAGGDIDSRTDIFSLGITLFEMLTGRKPFMGDSVVTITYNIVHEAPTFPPGLPDWLAAIIHKAIAKRPEDRYRTADDMAADLRARRGPIGSGVGSARGSWGKPAVGAQPRTFAPGQPNPAPSTYVFQSAPAPSPVFRWPSNPWDGLSEEMKVFWRVLVVTALVGLCIIALAVVGKGSYDRYRDAQNTREIAQVADTAMERGDFATAVRNYREAGRIAQTDVAKDLFRDRLRTALIRRSEQLTGRNRQAALMEAEKLDPESAEVNVAFGVLHEERGELKQALERYNKARQRMYEEPAVAEQASERMAAIYLNEGDRAFRSGNLDQARLLWQEAWNLAPAASEVQQQADARLGRYLAQ